MRKPKIVVAIPEQQHSFKLISSLSRLGFDTTYITTVYFKENSWLLKLMKVILPSKTYKRACGRHCDSFDDRKVIVYLKYLGLFQLMMQRVSRKHYRRIRKYKWDLFQHKIIRYCENNDVDILVLYEDYCSIIVDALKDTDTKIIIDCSAASKTYMKNIYESDSNGQLIDCFKSEYPVLWDEKESVNQFLQCDALLVPSSFSKCSYISIGINEEKVFVVGYPLDFNSERKQDYSIDKPLRLAYSGQVTYRKGIHHLLKAVEIIHSKFPIELYLFGTYDKQSNLYKEHNDKSYIHFMGWTLHDELFKQLSLSDLFVFPSLADSMSFSCLEAMKIGLPVICTSNTGASDYIANLENGIVIEPSSVDAIVDALIWCNENREHLKKMGEMAQKVVQEKTSIVQYDLGIKNLINTLLEIHEKKL